MISANQSLCTCGSGIQYTDCCGQFISNIKIPATAEQLMRSRYTAYNMKDASYLLKTWHVSTRPKELKLDIDTTCWQGLKVITANEHEVSFVAYFTDIKNPHTEKDRYALYEESEFSKDDQWYYVKGANLQTIQLSQNMSCPCQSGKKFKRCCSKLFTK